MNIPLPVTGILVGDVLVTNTAAEPVPVVVQNGDVDVVVLAEDVIVLAGTSGIVDLAPIDVSEYKEVTFFGISDFGIIDINFAFTLESSLFSASVPRYIAGSCGIDIRGMTCGGTGTPSGDSFKIVGPFLAVQFERGGTGQSVITLKALLRK